MRNILSLLAAAFCAALVLTCCEDNDKLPDDAKIYINGQDKTNKAASTTAKTVRELCLGDSLMLINENEVHEGWGASICTIVVNPNDESNNAIDTVNCRISVPARDINNFDLSEISLLDKNCHYFIVDGHSDGKGAYLGDTLAYIPTAQHHAIVDQLEELFKDKEANITEIYQLFSDAFVFIPCTAEEYKELEAAGLN